MLDLDLIADQAPPASSKTAHLLRQLEAAGEPIMISVNGRAPIPVADEASVATLITLVDQLELLENLRERLRSLDSGARTYSMQEAREMLRGRHGVSS